jgi:hypothetical protein
MVVQSFGFSSSLQIQIYMLTNNAKGSPPSHSPQHLFFFITAITTWFYLNDALICISFRAKDTEYLFIYLLGISTLSFEQCSIQLNSFID